MAQARASDLISRGLPEQLARHSDLLVSGGAVLIVAMLVVPLPHWALDASSSSTSPPPSPSCS